MSHFYEVEANGWRYRTRANSYGAAISRALTVLKKETHHDNSTTNKLTVYAKIIKRNAPPGELVPKFDDDDE